MSIIEDKVLMLNSLSLDKFYAQEQVSAGNLVNSGTPGYKRRVLEASCGFLDQMENAKELLEGKHKGRVDFQMEIKSEEGLSMQKDGNSVDRDAESIEMTKANFGFRCAEICLNSRFAMLGTVINSK